MNPIALRKKVLEMRFIASNEKVLEMGFEIEDVALPIRIRELDANPQLGISLPPNKCFKARSEEIRF